MNSDYWIKRFLYPFSLNKTPLKLSDYPIHGSHPEAAKIGTSAKKR